MLDILGQNDINGTLVFTNNNEDDIDGTIDWGFIMTKEYYIYVTTNNINGKKYIGQHKGKPEDNYFGSGTTITKALKKYGKENFSKEILCFCDTREEADEKEKYYIDFYDAIEDNNYYNNAEGGSGGDGWRSYQKWCKENPEEAKKQWQQNGQRLKEWNSNHPKERKKNVERMLTAAHQWQKENPDKVMQNMKKVNKAKEQWQKEHPEEHAAQITTFIKAGSKATSQKVICLTTGKIYASQSEASRQTGVSQANISKCLRGERKSAGKHPETGEKLMWRLCEDVDTDC